MNKALFLCAAMLFAAPALAQQGGRDYTNPEAGRAFAVKTGEVIDIRQVNLRDAPSPYASFARPGLDSSDGCAAVGATLGGLLGAQVGKGTGKLAAALVGVAGGAYGGKTACTQPKRGVELIIKLEDGRVVALIQEDDTDFAIGDKVRLVDGTRTRVSRIRT